MLESNKMAVENKQKTEVLVPEVEVRISESWISLINWCKNNIPNGQVCFLINNGEPGKLVNKYTEANIRFDKKSMQTPFKSFV